MNLELFELLTGARTTNELAVAAFTAVLLEHIETFPDEVSLIWKSHFSVSNVAYIRYLTLLAFAPVMLRAEWSDQICQSFLYGEMILSTIIVVSADIILVFRCLDLVLKIAEVSLLYGAPHNWRKSSRKSGSPRVHCHIFAEIFGPLGF
ncbi:hypothetical protein K438DRAFT_1832823, partial [Mycena galopus ATCC 62051]